MANFRIAYIQKVVAKFVIYIILPNFDEKQKKSQYFSHSLVSHLHSMLSTFELFLVVVVLHFDRQAVYIIESP